MIKSRHCNLSVAAAVSSPTLGINVVGRVGNGGHHTVATKTVTVHCSTLPPRPRFDFYVYAFPYPNKFEFRDGCVGNPSTRPGEGESKLLLVTT